MVYTSDVAVQMTTAAYADLSTPHVGEVRCDADRPNVGPGVGASASFNDGQTSATAVVSKVSAAGTLKVTNLGGGTAHIAVDVWYGSLWTFAADDFCELPARRTRRDPVAPGDAHSSVQCGSPNDGTGFYGPGVPGAFRCP